MKKYIAFFLAVIMVLSFALTACTQNPENTRNSETLNGSNGTSPGIVSTDIPDLGGDGDSFGADLSDEINQGYFEEDIAEVTVACVSGTPDRCTLEGNTLTFTQISEDSVYSVSGKLRGSIVIDAGDDYELELELQGFSLVSERENPIEILSGKVSITAKKDSENYIYDMRAAVDSEDSASHSAAVWSDSDLAVKGKGDLTVVSVNNNGIHSKGDLKVKNLNLYVMCVDNALKGNDSVTLDSCITTLIATQGDGIKTTNSDISKKGNQRGTVTVTGGTHTIYAACDGIDAAYDVVIEDDSTVLSIYTDKYSNYSEEITSAPGSTYYISCSQNTYQFSVKYYNSDEDYLWVNVAYDSKGANNYYYSFPQKSGYSQLKVFMYSSDTEQGQEENYYAVSDYKAISATYDTYRIASVANGKITLGMTNYATTQQSGGFGGPGAPGGFGGPGGHGGGRPGGMGGMQDGNKDKGDHSAKGIKSANEIHIVAGAVTIKSYDDAIHANNDTTLENGEKATGDLYVSGGTLTLYTNDDAIHADGTLTVSNGTINVTNSYEGLEGNRVVISGGNVSVISSDDGVNATATSGTGIAISGGNIYVCAGGDGFDSNSRTRYEGIVFSGGNSVIINTTSMNSAIDTEQGYQYTGGSVVAVMPSGGMSGEATNCADFSSVATNKTMSLQSGAYLTVRVNNNPVVTVQMPISLSARVIYLGSNAASFSTETATSAALDQNGVCWNEM